MTKAGCALFSSALLEIDCSRAVSQRCERAENVFCSRPGSFKVHCMIHGQGVGWDTGFDGVTGIKRVGRVPLSLDRCITKVFPDRAVIPADAGIQRKTNHAS